MGAKKERLAKMQNISAEMQKENANMQDVPAKIQKISSQNSGYSLVSYKGNLVLFRGISH